MADLPNDGGDKTRGSLWACSTFSCSCNRPELEWRGEENAVMPLRDHFRPPMDDLTSSEEFHGGWPMEIVRSLDRGLPPEFVAAPHVHHGAFIEVDVATFEKDHAAPSWKDARHEGAATAVWAPPQPTRAVETDLPDTDEYEVRVYDVKRGRRLVAAIEIVSPANKDRPEHRRAFVAKCSALLQKRVSVSIIDFVTTREFNLYADLIDLLGQPKSSPGTEAPRYAVACRYVSTTGRWRLESWEQPLTLGQPLPTLPLWLAEDFSIPLDLEESYEETCRVLRIP